VQKKAEELMNAVGTLQRKNHTPILTVVHWQSIFVSVSTKKKSTLIGKSRGSALGSMALPQIFYNLAITYSALLYLPR